ncbi:M48 family metalloprotease [Stakelama tenebrarum]|uniref:M48 family metalloprotease n=1 Tax=Stakelama tenebrarum TaxID=2711215 RepID=A0A6G6Y0H5_9SPHN|nr:M48 family metalloprotease [Sphingosinithalassobacter tenebrarum]QIG78422.1 M48 family metalloprotease [Sphingosinithalassobacter tenebrarum]
MKRFAMILACLCLFGLAARPASAQTMLRDAETEALLADISRPIIIAAGLSPDNVRVVLLQDKSINAFVAGGQTVYIHSGLIDAADNLNEVQGVIAHELGHVVGGHVPLRGDGGAGNISILSLVLGAAAIAAGSPEAGTGILMAGNRAALGKYLAFSRNQESAADAAGARFLNTAGINGEGMITFFQKLQNMEYRLAIPQDNSFNRTHPLSGERISHLEGVLQSAPGWQKPSDPALDRRFRRVQAKLRGFVDDPQQTLRQYPASDQSVEAHYARAYAYHLSGYPREAARETEALVAGDPEDPYFLELQGQIMLEAGDPRGALGPLRKATELSNNQPLIATTFGHALIATEDRQYLDEAEKVLRLAVAHDRENPFAWYQLGMVYEQTGDRARAALATAERASMTGDAGLAAMSARAALAGLEENTPDWLRAQDILLVSQNALEDQERDR